MNYIITITTNNYEILLSQYEPDISKEIEETTHEYNLEISEIDRIKYTFNVEEDLAKSIASGIVYILIEDLENITIELECLN